LQTFLGLKNPALNILNFLSGQAPLPYKQISFKKTCVHSRMALYRIQFNTNVLASNHPNEVNVPTNAKMMMLPVLNAGFYRWSANTIAFIKLSSLTSHII